MQARAAGTCPAIATDNPEGRTTCSGLDVVIAAVRPQAGQLFACQPGQTVPGVSLEIEFELSANGPRWDIIGGIQTANPALNPSNATLALAPGVAGVGPFQGLVGSGECVISSLDVGLDGIIIDGDPAPGDTCGDIPQGGAEQNVTQAMGTPIDIVCTPDPVNGGIGVPTIVTWQDQGSTQGNYCDADASNAGWYPTWPLSGDPNTEFLEEFQAAKCRTETATIEATIYGSLTVVKETTEGDDTFTFDWSTDEGAYDAPDEVVPASDTDVPLMNGESFEIFPILAAAGDAPATNTVTVTEDALAGWTLSGIACVDDEQNPIKVTTVPGGVQVDLNLNRTAVVCTFTNSPTGVEPGQITVAKVYNDGNQTPVDVDLDCGETGVVDTTPLAAAPGSPAVFDVQPTNGAVSCTATESGVPAGYTTDNSQCVDLDLGDSCTITNTSTAADFTVNKDFSNDVPTQVMASLSCTDGTVTTSPLPVSENNPAVFEVTGFEGDPNCTATESGVPDGYTTDNSDCVSVPLLADGECTIVNTLNTGTFTVRKLYSDDNEDPVSVTATCTSGDVTNNPQPASPSTSAVFEVTGFTDGATCTATEAVPPGYEGDISDCQDGDPINGSCEILNEPIAPRTSFRVQKDFSDDNPAGVQVSIECNTGLPLQQNAVIHDPEASGAPGDFTHVDFVVTDFEPGTMDCDIEEEIPAGYVPDYTAAAGEDGSAGSIFSDADGCHFEEVESGQFLCSIFNELQPVEVVVEKEWIDENPEFQLPTLVEVTLECDAPILGGFNCGGGNFCVEGFIDPDNPGVAQVLPHFDGSTCTATEEPIVGVVTDQSDCESMIVFPGQGDSCVIVNTRLFAGIPTLNQYGLILLALLMLGAGALAYRRFV